MITQTLAPIPIRNLLSVLRNLLSGIFIYSVVLLELNSPTNVKISQLI